MASTASSDNRPLLLLLAAFALEHFFFFFPASVTQVKQLVATYTAGKLLYSSVYNAAVLSTMLLWTSI